VRALRFREQESLMKVVLDFLPGFLGQPGQVGNRSLKIAESSI
jgi:hypothetical protein